MQHTRDHFLELAVASLVVPALLYGGAYLWARRVHLLVHYSSCCGEDTVVAPGHLKILELVFAPLVAFEEAWYWFA